MLDILLLISGLILILFAAEGFTNGIEGLGRRLSLSQAVVGSILAAVGTALPETVLPVVAILFYGGSTANKIGVGAILGAPFMLSTLAFFLVGITIVISFLVRKRRFNLNIEIQSIRRDLSFFIVMYSSAIIIPAIIPDNKAKILLSILLIIGYMFYAYRTFKGESMEIEHAEEVYIWKILKNLGIAQSSTPPLLAILFQVAVALLVMIEGAHIFVKGLEVLSVRVGMDPLIFALLLAPVATELPEKFNSVTWTWKGRDTLAIGNITGAMVFQSTFPVSIGLMFTDWKLTYLALLSAILAILSSILVLANIFFRKRVTPLTILVSGGLYLIYAAVLVLNH